MPFRSEGVNVLEKEQTIHFVTFEPTICTYKQILNTAHYLSCLGGSTTELGRVDGCNRFISHWSP
jgi:hypothetical protein